jgi:hypothetical protein
MKGRTKSPYHIRKRGFNLLKEDRQMRFIGLGIMVLALAPALWADDLPTNQAKEKAAQEQQTPTEQFRAITEEYQQARQDFFTEYGKAKTEEQKKELVKKFPQPEKYAARVIEIVEKNPKDGIAVDAVTWVLTYDPKGPSSNKAVDLLLRDHIDSPELGRVAGSLSNLAYASPALGERGLREILAKSPHKEVQGVASLSLGRFLKHLNKTKEAEDLFERVSNEFSTVRSSRGESLGEIAKHELFELRNLAIGKSAPEISGEDVEGKKFALSDYRGKVVVLDFWGNW